MRSWMNVMIVLGMITATGVIHSDDTEETPPFDLEVINESGKSFSYRLRDLTKLPQVEIVAKNHKGEAAKFSGVTVAAVLKHSDVTLGSGLKGPALSSYLLVEA